MMSNDRFTGLKDGPNETVFDYSKQYPWYLLVHSTVQTTEKTGCRAATSVPLANAGVAGKNP